MELDSKIHHRKSTRLKYFDDSQPVGDFGSIHFRLEQLQDFHFPLTENLPIRSLYGLWRHKTTENHFFSQMVTADRAEGCQVIPVWEEGCERISL
jgi:hypothetical protein